MTSQSPDKKIYLGQATPQTFFGDYNQINFIIQQALLKMQTATIVKVVACSNDGDISPVGTVDVIPLVNQIDGNNNAYPHGTIFGIPYMRIQGGTNAIILDPQPGDLGVCVFASRDISSIKSTKEAAPPASKRKFNYSDGIYLGGLLNVTPVNYIQFNGNDLTIKSTNINLIGNVNVTGSITSSGDVIADGISTKNHKHGEVQSGTDETGVPLP
jgi:hypothetical protein